MCGISAIAGSGWAPESLTAMILAQHHRGPDDTGSYIDPSAPVGLGHNRLSIIDLSGAGHQPMATPDGRLWIAFNGEIYNYLELRAELSDYPFRTQSDTEVILAAYSRWNEGALARLRGMFAFVLWDARRGTLYAVRDRFGVKPLHYAQRHGALLLASEIKAIHAAGVPAEPDAATWASYLAAGISDHDDRTFWRDVRPVPAGHFLKWDGGRVTVRSWYELADAAGIELDRRPHDVVADEYLSLLRESVRLRFRADVPVGINLSGGLDSSVLLGLVQQVQGQASDVRAFTFVTGDPRYDELPWVEQMLARTAHPSEVCPLSAAAVPALADSVQWNQDEPFGGLPTLCYARLFEHARARGIKVLLDGQGMDEQWAGYDYYAGGTSLERASTVQGTSSPALRPECLTPEFRREAIARPLPQPYPDRLRNLQYRDLRVTKIPRALRFNDRASMRASTELREPFLDHQLVELALRQPPERKILNGTRKRLLRELAQRLLPAGVVEAPKRPLQTPQREWLRGPLREWASAAIDHALAHVGGSWLDSRRVRAEWEHYLAGHGDNSVFLWQWINAGLLLEQIGRRPTSPTSTYDHDSRRCGQVATS
jgi:asparagine synthase (glutamine-hydrolysing)